MNVVFLDVDGELTYSDYENDETAHIDIEKVKLLKEICDRGNAKVVISSSWRGFSNGHKPKIYFTLLKILEENGIEVIGDTPHINTEFEDQSMPRVSINDLDNIPHCKIKYGTGRAAEVQKWLSENDVENFVILDDEDFDWSDYGYDTHWVQPTWFGNGGLKREYVEKAVEILGCKSKYIRVMFGTTSGGDANVKYKINEVNIANNWHPELSDPKEMGGFNFSNEENILRWIVRGNTVYDVELPADAEVVVCENKHTPNGVFRTNKIIVKNPRMLTDDVAMYYYEKSNMPEETYYQVLNCLALRGCINTAKRLIQEKINQDNIKEAFAIFDEFVRPYREEDSTETYNEVRKILEDIKQKAPN